MRSEVLKHGSWYYTEKCPRCECEFAFTPFNLRYEYHNIDEPNEVHTEHINCPECNYEFIWPEFTHHSIEEDLTFP